MTPKEETFFEQTYRFIDSIGTYETLVHAGINKSDAIHIVPRGLKMGIIKTWDLYNATTGYASLRLCSTAEPEMKQITEAETALIRKKTPKIIGELIAPKCSYTGFCPDRNFCGNILKIRPGYINQTHIEIQQLRAKEIRSKLNNQ